MSTQKDKEDDIAIGTEVFTNEGLLEELINTHGVNTQPQSSADRGMLVGEVIDTHHPHRAGRILVRWTDSQGILHEHWLSRAANTRTDIGTRVLITRPANWSEWVVVSSLSTIGESPATTEEQPKHQSIRLEADEPLQVETADGKLLFELLHRDRGAVLKLSRDFNLELPGTFRVIAERIELHSGQSGTDTRSEGEMVFRSPRIRLN